jgi:hypothetical protein
MKLVTAFHVNLVSAWCQWSDPLKLPDSRLVKIIGDRDFENCEGCNSDKDKSMDEVKRKRRRQATPTSENWS